MYTVIKIIIVVTYSVRIQERIYTSFHRFTENY